jgi:hypothetical protein
MSTESTTSDHTVPPWEPPFAGTEVEHLLAALDRLRTTFRWKADGLDAAGLATRVGASALTIGGLLKHLAVCEEFHTNKKLRDEPLGEPWTSMEWDGSEDWDFRSAAADSPEALYELYDGSVQRSRRRIAAALDDGGLDQSVLVAAPDGTHASLRRLLFDLVEEYGRHTGHADLIREAIDGRVGEDPPEDWRPVSGSFTFH